MLQIDNEKYYRRSVVSTIKGRSNDLKTREKIENFLKCDLKKNLRHVCEII